MNRAAHRSDGRAVDRRDGRAVDRIDARVAALALVLLAVGGVAPGRAQETSADAAVVRAGEAGVQDPLVGTEGADVQDPLVREPGWELVYAHCSACHSLQLVTAQRGDADTWRRLIRWMQETQNLWELDAATEAGIVGYLAEHYAPRGSWRRAPLAPELMPPG